MATRAVMGVVMRRCVDLEGRAATVSGSGTLNTAKTNSGSGAHAVVLFRVSRRSLCWARRTTQQICQGFKYPCCRDAVRRMIAESYCVGRRCSEAMDMHAVVSEKPREPCAASWNWHQQIAGRFGAIDWSISRSCCNFVVALSVFLAPLFEVRCMKRSLKYERINNSLNTLQLFFFGLVTNVDFRNDFIYIF